MPEQLTCDQCSFTFQRHEHYLRHLRTHTKEKPFQCTVCGHAFGRIDSLARHHSSSHVDPTTLMVSTNPVERKRVSRACKRCSTSKVRCDGQLPCEKCSQSDTRCYYEEPKKRKSGRQQNNVHPAKRRVQSQNASSNEAGTSDTSEGQQTPAAQSQPMASAPLSETDAQVRPLEIASIGQSISNPNPEIGGLACYNEIAPYSSTFDLFNIPNIPGFQNDFDDIGWMTGSFDPYIWPTSFDLDQDLGILQDNSGSSANANSKQVSGTTVPRIPVDLPPGLTSEIADLYSRSNSPALDRDGIEVRKYHPTSIEIDAPLHFPDVDPASVKDADLEDFAHVETLSNNCVNAIVQLAEDVQQGPHYPLFTNLKLPPQPILNAWVQLYFEYFHPIFPILHKPTFSSSETHPLLVLTVAGIGAQFSNLNNAGAFARCIRELVRRQSSFQCERKNQLGCTVWMIQVLMLNSLAMSHSGDRRELEIAEALQSIPAALARRRGIMNDVLSHDRMARLQLPLEQTWRLWAVDEERRRAGFGVWLVDIAFRNHFNLTSVMDPCELRNTLPRTEDQWGAGSAQSWAGYPPGLGSSGLQTLGETYSRARWLSVWPKTGTIGKQVILSELMEQASPRHSFHCHKSVRLSDSSSARETLQNLLAMMDIHRDEVSHDMKVSLTHKVMCIAALMTCHAPVIDLTVIALRQIYHRLDDHELSNIAEQWRECPEQGRITVYYAARLFETVRNSLSTHYAIPAYLLKAVLILWLYARLFNNENLTGFSASFGFDAPALPNIKNPNDLDIHQWTREGCSRICLSGIDDLQSLQGRRKLLSESVATMRSLKSWGISMVYTNFLERLESSEAAA